MSLMNIVTGQLAKSAYAGRRFGFTLIEMLVVVALISLLISMLLPALNVARDTADHTVCMTRLNSMYRSCANYALDNITRLPDLHNSSGAWGDNTNTTPYWYSVKARDHLIDYYGHQRNYSYCPSNQLNWNRDDFWNWPGGTSSVWGYFYFGATRSKYNSAGAWTFTENPGDPIFASTTSSKPRYKVLMADLNRQCCGFDGDGWFGPQRRGMNHSKGTVPAGSNEVFFDGHAEWIPWIDMSMKMLSGDSRYHW